MVRVGAAFRVIYAEDARQMAKKVRTQLLSIEVGLIAGIAFLLFINGINDGIAPGKAPIAVAVSIVLGLLVWGLIHITAWVTNCFSDSSSH
jgi:uncharacterized membrane protein HdeD (DUF308 family)